MKILVPLLLTLTTLGIADQLSAEVVQWTFDAPGPTDGRTTTNGIYTNYTVAPLTQGNNNGTVTLISGTSPSAGYTNASGGNNAAAAAFIGALNPATSTFFAFTFTPATGYSVQATGFTLGERSTGTGPQLLTLRSSLDNFTTDIATAAVNANSTWSLVSLSPFSLTAPVDTAVTFRLYGSNGTGTTTPSNANWRIDDLSFTANAIAVPEPGTWAMVGGGLLTLLAVQRRWRGSVGA